MSKAYSLALYLRLHPSCPAAWSDRVVSSLAEIIDRSMGAHDRLFGSPVFHEAAHLVQCTVRLGETQLGAMQYTAATPRDVNPNQRIEQLAATIPSLVDNGAHPTEDLYKTPAQWTSAVNDELRRRERARAPKVQPDHPDDWWPSA